MNMTWQEKRNKEIEKLLSLITQKFSVKKDELISKSRKRNLVSARRYFMNIIFETFEIDAMKHVDISKIIKRDRTSFIHNRKEHLNEYNQYKTYKQEYDNFKKEYQTTL